MHHQSGVIHEEMLYSLIQEVAKINASVKEEEYKGSDVFLKGTQSANPHNDYSQHFIDTGQRAQNFIRDVGKPHP